MSSDAQEADTTWGSVTTIPAECYDVLQSPRRLRVLLVLGQYTGALTLSELASELLDRQPEQTHDAIRVDLVHNQLPRLAEHGVVDWDRKTGIELADWFPIGPRSLSTLLEYCESGGPSDRTTLETIVHPVRLPLCSILADSDQPQSLEELATALVDAGVTDTTHDQAAIELHHAHLPALADAELLIYDFDAKRVYNSEHPIPAVL